MNTAILQIIGKRILQAIPVVFGVTFIVFAVLNLLPGGTAEALLGVNATPALVHDLTVRPRSQSPISRPLLPLVANGGRAATSEPRSSPTPAVALAVCR